jgi:hypothetical protein
VEIGGGSELRYPRGASLWAVLALGLACTAQWQACASDLVIGDFSHATLQGWQSRSFVGETRYELVRDSSSGHTVLSATSDGTASGLYREMTIDLTKTPYLNWSWLITKIFPGIDETQKAGDDFPARVFVVIRRGLLGMDTIALNYVWASQHSRGSLWASPYSSQVRLLAIDAGGTDLGTWIMHKRDLREDLRSAFGEDISAIDAIAIMTDTDDHKGHAKTYYGDIWLSAH